MTRLRSALFAVGAGAVALSTVLLVHTSGAANAPAQPPAVPVTAEQAKVQDVPVFLTGLGTVRALNTVVVKAQVNGTLIAIPVRQGQEVHRGDVVAQIDPAPYQAALDQAIAQRAGDQAQLASAQQDLQRYQTLAKRSFAPVQQVDQQQAAVNKLSATVAADSAAVETAQINLNYCTIRSPIDGRVGFYQTDVGNLIQVSSQTGILTITQDMPIEAVFTLPEADLPRVQAGMARDTLPVQAWSADGRTRLADGTLLTPDNTVDTATGTIQLLATFANENDRLWPGAFVNARVQVETLRNAVTIPLASVQHGPNGVFVYLVKPDATAQVQPVTLGYQTDTSAVVTKGLQGGETVVTSGQSRLAPGAHVAVQGGSAPAQANAG